MSGPLPGGTGKPGSKRVGMLGPQPHPPDWQVPWQAYQDVWWVKAMRGCAQSPLHHAEGDVWVHTGMVLEALAADPAFRALGPDDRAVLFAAALLHDVAKPECSRDTPEGITTAGHARRGSIFARELLWRAAVAPPLREQVAALVTHHMVPFWLLEGEDSRLRLLRLSQTTRCDLLAILASADARGRICSDQQELLDNVEMFRLMAEEQGVLRQPYAFPDDHSRVTYFRKGGDPDRQVFHEPTALVTVMAGLPASGKDTYLSTNLLDLPRISLDALRDELEVAPTAHQAAVIEAARAQAREYLRKGQAFVWNATNLSRDIRSRCLNLIADYGADAHIAYVETTPEEMERRNQSRSRPVPAAVVRRMLSRWEMPDLTEARTLSCHYS